MFLPDVSASNCRYSAGLDVLEVQRQALTFVFLGLREQARRLGVSDSGLRVDFDREFIVGLVRKLLVLRLRP